MRSKLDDLAVAQPTIWIQVVGAAMFLASLGCSRSGSVVPEQPVPKVTVSEVIQQETADFDEFTGRTEASETVEVRARVFGYLKSIDFEPGAHVMEDQTLFTIEPDEYDAIYKVSLAQIALWESKYELAKSKLARSQILLEKNATSREENEEAVAAVREAEAAINAARADANRTAVDLKYTVIRAPIEGRIDRPLVTRGNLLTGGQASGTLLTTIVKEQPMFVYFDVDERSLLRYMRRRREQLDSAPGSLRDQGVDCFVQLADETNFPHRGKLDFAANEMNRTTGTARLRGVFANEDRMLTSGMFVRVRVPVSEPYLALMVPESAIATDQSVKFVYVVGDDGLASRRAVTLGDQRGELRIIAAGLKVGERVIVKGLQRVRSGQPVEAEVAEVTEFAAGAQEQEL